MTPPRRVALLSPLAGLSGSDRALLRLVERMDRRRFCPLVVLPCDGPLQAELAAREVPCVASPLSWWIPATHWTAAQFAAQAEGLTVRTHQLGALLHASRVELVHTNTLVNLEGALAAAAVGVPHVFHSRGLMDRSSPPAYFADRRLLFGVLDRLSDALVCVSHAVEAQAAEHCRRTLRQVIPDGLDLAAFTAGRAVSRGALLASLGIAGTCRLVVCLAGVQRRKGQNDLVAAVERLGEWHRDTIFVLAGELSDPDYAADLRSRLSASGLSGRVLLPGFVSDIRSLLEHAEMLVHPSHSEGFGLAILEAMALGRPVVATRCGGPEEVVEDGISGLLVPPARPDLLGSAIESLLADESLRLRLGVGAVERSLRFDLSATVAAIETLYERLPALGPTAASRRARLAARVERVVSRRIRQAAAS